MAKQSSKDLVPILGESNSAPIVRSIADLTVNDFIAAVPVVIEKPYRECRVPGTQKEYEALKSDAESPSPGVRGSGPDSSGTDPSANDSANFTSEPEALSAPSEDGLPLATQMGMPEALAPSSLINFNGINATSWVPPDCTTAVGPNHVLVAVNVAMTCYTKTGSLVFTIPNLATFLGSAVPAGAKIFDPKLIYDHYAGRYVLVITAVRNSPEGSWIIIAASTTNNPSGTWTLYTLNALSSLSGVNAWADYPTVGFDSQAIYVSTNQFTFGGGAFQQSRLRILKKAQIYAAAAVTWSDYNNLTNNDGTKAFTIQPCTHFHGGGNSPAYFVNAYWPTANGASKLTLWKLQNPITTPSLTRVAINVNNFKMPPNAIQPGGGSMTTGDVRLLNAMYQFAGGVQRVWTAHTVRVQWAGDSAPRSAVRWYEIDVNTNTVVQQQDYGASGFFYSYPAIHTDLNRNAYMVFTAVSSTTFAQMRQTGRRVSAVPSTMEGSVLVKAGASAHTSGRWGDYFGIARDPSNTSEVWGFAEYANLSGQWGTWIIKMRF